MPIKVHYGRDAGSPELMAEFKAILQHSSKQTEGTNLNLAEDKHTPIGIYEQCMDCLKKHNLVKRLQLPPTALLTHFECRSKQMLNPQRLHKKITYLWVQGAWLEGDLENNSLCVQLEDNNVTHYSYSLDANHKIVSRSEE